MKQNGYPISKLITVSIFGRLLMLTVSGYGVTKYPAKYLLGTKHLCQSKRVWTNMDYTKTFEIT